MEASALTHAGRRGLLPRRSPVLRFQGDERLVALIRSGHDRAFEVLFDRYHGRLLAFCRSMLKSEQDAEDVLQEVFAAAHKAMLGDDRRINLRPWLYRIARNRCLNHLRKPVAEGQDTMDYHPHENGTTTDDRVQKREELRLLIADVKTLPETQRTALLLREIDALSYEEIAQAMDATIPSVKSLLVRARITLAESSEARLLTCDEVRLELAEAAEGLRKASGPVRQHVRGCEECRDFRGQLRSDRKALASIFPLGPIALLQAGLLAKLGLGGGAGTGAAGGAAGGTGAIGGGAAASGTAGIGGLGGLGSIGGIGGAIGGAVAGKVAAGVATAALLTAGAVEVSERVGAGDTTGGAQSVAPAIDAPPADVQKHYGETKADRKHRADKKTATADDVAATDGAADAAPVAGESPADELTGGAPAGSVADGESKAGDSSGGGDPEATLVPGVPPIVVVGIGGETSGGTEGSGGLEVQPEDDPGTEDPGEENPPVEPYADSPDDVADDESPDESDDSGAESDAPLV